MGKVVRIDRSSVKEELKYSRFLEQFPDINLGSMVVTFMCIITMIIATFTLIPVGIFNEKLFSDPFYYFSDINNLILTLHSHLYSPQVPVAIFAGALLGYRLGTFSMITYVVLGLLGIPLFASGGGIEILHQPVFGFIFGYILAAFLVGKIFTRKVTSLDIIFAALLGVVTIHFFGVIYLIANMFFSGYSMEYIKAWVWGLSFINLPYDILFAIVLCALARPVRGLFWIAME